MLTTEQNGLCCDGLAPFVSHFRKGSLASSTMSTAEPGLLVVKDPVTSPTSLLDLVIGCLRPPPKTTLHSSRSPAAIQSKCHTNIWPTLLASGPPSTIVRTCCRPVECPRIWRPSRVLYYPRILGALLVSCTTLASWAPFQCPYPRILGALPVSCTALACFLDSKFITVAA
jgi:hypothetical protein